MPPRWTPLSQPIKLDEDSGDYFRDRNAARYPTHPMEPAVVAALNDAHKQCDSAEVDLVACSSTLGNLLRSLRGEQKPFRILVEEVGNTMFFIRREKSPTEKIPDVRGFGHTFPEHYTTWDECVKSSTSHQRLLSYDFGGMRCFVRFEADGYLPATSGSSSSRQTNAKAQGTASADFDDLLSTLESTTVDTGETTATTTADGLDIKSSGAKVDQSQIFDLKTRSFRRKFNQDTLSDELPRLWVSQIPNFVLAYHNNGVFDDIRVQDVRTEVAAWEAQQRPVLARLAALLHRIRELVQQNPAHKLELCHTADRPGKLQVRQQLPDAGNALSAKVKARWLSAASAQEEKDDGVSVGSDTDSDSAISFGVNDGEEDFTDCSGACGYCGHCASVKKV